jgi:MerR family transcriptional regulator/heat shock protein HspR
MRRGIAPELGQPADVAPAQVPVYTMAVAARLTGMHPQTLRKYERAGLIRPARGSGHQRLYSAADLERLRRIQYLVEQRGLNVAGLQMTLATADRLDAVAPGAPAEDLRIAIDEATDASRTPRPRAEPPRRGRPDGGG